MKKEDFTKGSPGRLVKIQGGALAFIPEPLPPRIEPTNELMDALAEARAALGEWAGIGGQFPEMRLLIRPFRLKEAEASSRIEGTEAELDELFVHEADPASRPEKADAVEEVRNYLVALDVGMERVKEIPVSLRLVRELHKNLMEGVRGGNKAPGEFRRIQNRVGGSSLRDALYVPPPVPQMSECISDWEKFIHADSEIQPLIRLALLHYQFEAIHPFMDGNGRVGRLLIPILMYVWDLLPQPVLYLSAYFERNRREYFSLLLDVSQRGNWREWILFFLRGVEEQARDAAWRARKLLDKKEEFRQRIRASGSATALRLADDLMTLPICTSRWTAERLGVTQATAIRAIQTLEVAEILKEETGRRRNRRWVAREILDVLTEEAPPEVIDRKQATLVS